MKKKRNKKSYIPVSRWAIIFALIVAMSGVLYYQTIAGKSHVASEKSKKSLQLGTFRPTTAASTPILTRQPTPTVIVCNYDNGLPVNDGRNINDPTCFCQATMVVCKDNKCVDIIQAKSRNPWITCAQANNSNWCGKKFLAPTDGTYCLGKPVIYLYPEVPTFVDVSVKTTGKIVASDPPYPPGGWNNVLAQPNGKLTYEKKTYRELFYETESTSIVRPKTGIVIKTSDLKSSLNTYVTLLGLTRQDERKEFLDWWLPRLKNLNSPYIFFSILEPSEKERLDRVTINPKPDTMIEFIAYFAPLKDLINVTKLELPATPPKRIGFTAVEWGGVIGK